ncbi:LOW QUALITY PROTEIN: enoyl-[acyl-carrier-protein] reductase [Geomicrobium sp. JCM 19039]|nr:LOW QUALITY PROTEIN: enoyl-[acyl-carrier-protein] reductase [Geomicrobium sp. JCM 19039]
MWYETRISERFGINYPIVQAGMAGGSTTAELVASVSNAGGLGTLGLGIMTPEQIRKAIHDIRKQTERPFAVNLFVSTELAEDVRHHIQHGLEVTRPFRDTLGINEPVIERIQESFDEQLHVIVEEQVPVFSFTFGIPTKAQMEKLKEQHIITSGTATTVQEAIQLEAAGVDTIVAQGSEAGGHRGTFETYPHLPMVGTMALVPQIVDHVNIPVIAAGGIMDGRGVAASLMLGASGVQLGTAFLTAEESGAHALHKQALLESDETSTVITKAFSGKEARGYLIRSLIIFVQAPPLPPYPIQHAVTKGIRKASGDQGSSEYMSLWAGQATRLNRRETAANLMKDIVNETTKRIGE